MVVWSCTKKPRSYNMSEHFDKIKEIVIDKLGVEESKVTVDAKFIDDLGADSLDTVELIMQFEEEFGIEIPDDDAENLLSVKQAVDYITEKLG
jgi:acyl carrier protein